MKPVCFEKLELAVEQVLRRAANSGGEFDKDKNQNVDKDRDRNKDRSKDKDKETETLIGHSPAWEQAIDRARQAAATDADILIEAESGTGKELVARLIHRLSRRKPGPFVAVNCAAFPETLLESELFGHARGAFTGAVAARPGKFETANGGTLLLDEVGEMPLALQPKLLRALQEREFDRLGDTRSVKVDMRVIATTNRPLERMVRAGEFRADLYYRLNVIPLSLPPLRDRPQDIAELARHFADRYAAGGTGLSMAPEFLARLQQHSWPGNVRELANLMRRAAALCAGEIGIEVLEPSDLGASLSAPPLAAEAFHAGLSMETMEKRLLQITLDATAGNRSRAAEMLGVSLRTVRNKIRDYGLPPKKSYARSYAHD